MHRLWSPAGVLRTVGPFAVVLTLVLIGFRPLSLGAEETPQSVALGNNLERWNVPVQNLAVGTAFAADAEGLQGSLTNPASLTRIGGYEFTLEHQQWGEGWDLFTSGVALPFSGGQSAALQGSWLEYGELEPADPTELFRPRGTEFKTGVTYAHRFHPSAAWGISAHVMSSKIGFRDREYGFSFDLGALLRLTDQLWIGATGRNIGGDLRVDDGPNKLPTQYRAGIAYYAWQDRVGVTADGIFIEEDSRAKGEESSRGGAGGGMRLLLFDHVRLSAGYHSFYTNRKGLTGGLELDFPNLKGHIGFLDTGEEQIIRVGGSARF